MHIVRSTYMNTLSYAELPIPVVCIVYALTIRHVYAQTMPALTINDFPVHHKHQKQLPNV